jgi:hypothetical protein
MDDGMDDGFMESWRGFADQLPEKEKQVMKMLNDCYKYSTAINAKGQPFPSEGAIMSLLLSQHKLIEWLENQWGKKLWDVKNGNEIGRASCRERV